MFNSSPPSFQCLLLPTKQSRTRVHQRSVSDFTGDRKRESGVTIISLTPSSFSPPSNFDDLSDFHKKTRDSGNFDHQTQKDKDKNQQSPFEIIKVPIQETNKKTSLLTDCLNKTETRKAMIQKHITTVFLTDMYSSKFKVEIQITKRTTGHELIIKSIHLSKELNRQLLINDPNGYHVRVSNKDGDIDQDIPIMDKKVPILDLGFSQFILITDENYKLKVKEKKEVYLEDIKMKVNCGENEVKILNISPDIFVQDLLSVVCKRLGYEKENYYVNLIMDGVPEPPLQYKYRTIKSLNLDTITLGQIFKPEKDDWVYLSQDQITRQSSTFVFPKIMDTISEYRIYILRKFSKEEVKLGFDSNFLYQEFTNRSLFGKETKTYSEKPLSTLLVVIKNDNNPKKFTLKFIDEELNYETKTVVESDEIVKQLRQNIDISAQKRNQTGFFKRKNSSIGDLELGLQDIPIVKVTKSKKETQNIEKKDVKQWNISDVGIWLDSIGFGALKDKFAEEMVDGEVLIKITLNDLKDDFELPLDPRKKLFARITDLKEQMKKGKINLF